MDDNNSKSMLDKRKNNLEQLDRASREAAQMSNNYELHLTNGLFTATTAFLALIIAFMGNIKSSDVFSGLEWMFALGISLFALSLIPWLIDRVFEITLFRRRMKMCDKYRTHVVNAVSLDVLNAIEIMELERLNDKKNMASSTIPRTLQIILFVLGLVFSATTIVICLFI